MTIVAALLASSETIVVIPGQCSLQPPMGLVLFETFIKFNSNLVSELGPKTESARIGINC